MLPGHLSFWVMPRGGKRPGAGRKPKAKPTVEDVVWAIRSPKTFEKLLELRLRKFGLTKEQHGAMLREQNGRCALCDEPLSAGWVIDHDHLTMRVRGLLHANCNTMLGLVNEDPRRLEKAIAYLKKHNTFLK